MLLSARAHLQRRDLIGYVCARNVRILEGELTEYANIKNALLAECGEVGEDGGAQVVKLSEKNLAWKDVARVQLWPEKCMILYYAPAGWLRIAVACTPFTWEDVMGMTREKLGKKRKIRLPQSLVIPAEPKPRRAKPQASASPEVEEALEQLRMEELMQQAEETDPQ
jgi:hypothetical protein